MDGCRCAPDRSGRSTRSSSNRLGGGGRLGSGALVGRQEGVEHLAGDLLELDALADGDDLVAIHDVDVTLADVAWLRLHADVVLQLHAGDQGLGELHRTPTVGHVDVLLRVQEVGGVADEAGNVASTVDVVRRAVEVTILRLGGEVENGRSLSGLAIEDDLRHGTVLVGVGDESLEELVSHAALDLVGATGHGLLGKDLHLGLDHVVVAGPLGSPSCLVLVEDGAVGVVDELLAVRGDTAVVQLDSVGSEVGDGLELDVLTLRGLGNLCNQRLANLHATDVHAGNLSAGASLLPDVITNGECHVGVQRRWAKGSVVDQVATDDRVKLLISEVALDDNLGAVSGELFRDDTLDGGGKALGRGLSDWSGSNSGAGPLNVDLLDLRSLTLGESPVVGVVNPVLLVVEAVGGKSVQLLGVVELVVEFIEVEVDTGGVESAHTGRDGLPGILVAAKRRSSDGRTDRGLDHAGANGVCTNLEPGSLLVEDLGLLASSQGSPEVDSLTSVASKVLGVDDTSLADDLTLERREDGDDRLAEGDGRSDLLESLKDRVNLGGVECERHVQLGGLEALGGKCLVGSTDDLAATTEDGLLRAVDASDLSHLRAKSGTDGIGAALDGQHTVSVRSAVADEQLSTATDKENHVGGGDDTGDV